MMIGMRVSFGSPSSGTASGDKVPAALGIAAGSSPSGKTKPLPGSSATIALTFGFLIAVSQPGPAGLGMGERECPDRSCRTAPTSHRRSRLDRKAGVGRDRAEELVQRLRLSVELHAVKVVRPSADPELVEEELIVGRRLDGRGHGAVAGAAAARLVDEIDREARRRKMVWKPSRPSDVVSQLRAGLDRRHAA